MTAPPPRRSWWRRNRTWAAITLWLAAYVLSLGAAEYASARRWIPEAAYPVFNVVYYPLLPLAECDVSPADCLRWCWQKGGEARAEAERRRAEAEEPNRE